MKISKIVERINIKLAGELLSQIELEPFLDDIIDFINAEMHSTFPAFSELDGVDEYTAFPDKYIRMIVIPGAAFYFYQADEEGINASAGYESEVAKGLFYMKRDYSDSIPEEYQATGGTVDFTAESGDADLGERGVEIDGSIWQL